MGKKYDYQNGCQLVSDEILQSCNLERVKIFTQDGSIQTYFVKRHLEKFLTRIKTIRSNFPHSMKSEIMSTIETPRSPDGL